MSFSSNCGCNSFGEQAFTGIISIFFFNNYFRKYRIQSFHGMTDISSLIKDCCGDVAMIAVVWGGGGGGGGSLIHGL